MKKIEKIIAAAAQEGRSALNEWEVYTILDILGLGTPERLFIPLDQIPSGGYEEFEGGKVVLKIVSHSVLHKTESGGVVVCGKIAAKEHMLRLKKAFPRAEGVLVSEFVEHPQFALGSELMIGARQDKAFGPVLVLGVGGTDAEALTASLRLGVSPAVLPCELASSDADWQSFLNSAWVWRYCSGKVRGGRRILDDAEPLKWLKAFAKLVQHFSPSGKSEWVIEEVEVNPAAVSGAKLIALDGILRFRPKKEAEGRLHPPAAAVDALLKPSVVAVAGVSEKKMNMGRIILGNVLGAGFPKEKTFVLKDFKGEIDGVKCVPSASKFPETVDMLVVAVPSSEAAAVLEDAAKSGKVRGVVLISGGMGEKEGTAAAKDKVMEVLHAARAKKREFALSGGNSLGIVSNPSKVNTLFIPREKLPPPLGATPFHAPTAFVSQSGAFVITVLSKEPRFKPVYCVTVGNQMDITVADYVERIAEDASIKAVFAYVEGLKEGDGLRLAACARKLAQSGRKLGVYFAGRTPAGQKAVMGHTASIAGDFAVARSVLLKEGAFVAQTLEDFEDYIQLCTCFCNLKPPSGKLFALSNAGFESAAMADNVDAKSPLTLPVPGQQLSAKLAQVLKTHGLDSIVDVKNP
ncbi:MAG TPA: acetate--CoA ligase family protein, partial [Elusimicrobiales bacterium]|nr:acetate--CoA ligase family protein [Elusimicrobiales bacterium]